MSKIISFMHISLDGFVAGPNGEMNWITLDQNLFNHVEQRIGKTNTALYGRKTFQMMEAYWPTAADKPDATDHDRNHSAWYKTANKVVLSKTLNEKDFNLTEIISDNLAENLQKLKDKTPNEILLFGSPSATHSLMKENLIDGFWLFVNPIVLGEGIPLFIQPIEKSNLTLVKSKQFECGVVEMSYVVNRSYLN